MTKTNFAAGQLRSLIDLVLTLKAEQDDLSADVSEIYKEAHSAGFDKNVMRSVVQRLRKEEKNGADRMAEADAITELYLDAYRGGLEGGGELPEGNRTGEPAEPAQRPPVARRGASSASPRVRARDAYDPMTGEVTDEQHPASATSCAKADKAGEGDAVVHSASPVEPSYDAMAGDPGPMPAFLRRNGAKVAA